MTDPTTRPYRIELPNLIDDLDLSVYAFRLYVHIKRVAGQNGTCYEGTRKLAEKCGMSLGQVSKAKKELIERGLVSAGSRPTNGGQTDELKPVDLWQQNYERYADQGVHTVNTFDTEPDKGVHHVNEGVHTVNKGVHHVNERKNHEERTIKKSVGSAGAKAPRAQRPPKQASMSALSEPVQVYKELSGQKNLAPVVADRITDTVVDIEHWRRVVSAWCGKYTNKGNVDGMLDWYLHPELMPRSNGVANNGNSNRSLRSNPRQPPEPAQWRSGTDDEFI